MLTRIQVTNLGCFAGGPYALELGHETFIVGPNNVGKSTFLAAFALNQFGGFVPNVTRFADFDDAIFAHDINSELVVSIDASVTSGPAGRTVRMRRGQGLVIDTTGSPAAQNELQALFQKTWYLMSDRSQIPISQALRGPQPSVDPQATNTITFLLEQWTSQNPFWPEAQMWLKKVDPSMSLLKSPLRGQNASILTTREYQSRQVDVNLHYQGAGIQRALQIISVVVFSPQGSLIFIEEPEMNLHRETQEILVDLFNKAVNEWGKQIVLTTHAWETVRPIVRDIGPGNRRNYARDASHVKTDPTKFKMAMFTLGQGRISIADYSIPNKEFDDIQRDFNLIWGQPPRRSTA